MRFLKSIVLVISICLGTNVVAQTYPEPITPYVSDFANLIDPETEARIVNNLIDLRKDLDLEMRVVTIESRFDYGDSETVEAFTEGLFETWGVGDKTRNDGALILISRSDREIRIELGTSYGPIYDDRMGLVIQHHFLPYFKGDEYSAGIEAGTLEAIKRLHPTYDVVRPETLEKPSLWTSIKRTPFWRFFEDKLAILIFLGVGGFLFFENRLRSILVGLTPCPNCRQRQLRNRRMVKHKPTYAKRGEEIVETFCSSCDFHSTETRSLPKLRDENDNGRERVGGHSNRGGGGKSSGGGATGRW